MTTDFSPRPHPSSNQGHPGTDQACRADLGEAQLEYWQRGSGPTVLLVHAGVFGGWFAPVYADPALDGFHVVRVHRAGYGASTSGGRPVGVGDHARHCAQLLEHLGVTSACWVGHSSGGSITLQAAIDRPDLMCGMALLESAPKPEGPSAADLGRDVVGPAMAAFAAGDVATAADIFLAGVGGPACAGLVEERLGPDGRGALERDALTFFSEEIPALLSWVLDPAALAGIRTSALLVTGARGLQTTRAHQETTELLGQMLPNAETVDLPDVGHAMPLEDPATIATLIARFVDRTHG